MHFLKADKSRSNRMSANLVRWREKKLMSKKGALTHEEIAERQSKIDELHAQIAERRRRALELREAKKRELDRMRLVRKDAARAAAAGDGFDEAVAAGGDLAAAAEQAELEELRRLEAHARARGGDEAVRSRRPTLRCLHAIEDSVSISLR